MGRVFEFCQYPKLLLGDYSSDEVFNVVVDLVVCHGSNYDVVAVRDAFSAVYNEIQPCVCHAFEIADGQSLVGSIFIDADCGSFLSHCPPLCLSLQFCAVEAFSEILGELAGSDFRLLYFCSTSVEYSHNLLKLLYLMCVVLTHIQS